MHNDFGRQAFYIVVVAGWHLALQGYGYEFREQ